MLAYDDLLELAFKNIKHIAYPEEWLALDIEMSKQELFTLIIIDKLSEITMSQISDEMNFPMSTATGIIDRLVKKGYVQREKSENDRRIVVIVLTDKGKHLSQSLKNYISDYIRFIYDSLEEDEREYLFRILNKILVAFRDYKPISEEEKIKQNKVTKIQIE